MAKELWWEKQGKHVIFPESAEFLDNLLDATFDLSTMKGFTLPFQSFMLPMPVSYHKEGAPIRGLLVNSYQKKDTLEILRNYARFMSSGLDKKASKALNLTGNEIAGPLSVAENMVMDSNDGYEDDEWLLSICVMDANREIHTASTIRASEAFTRIPDLLKAQSAAEFQQLLGDLRTKNYDVRGLSQDDAVAEFYAFKIVCALAVYNMATNGEMQNSGMPGSKAPHIEGKFDRKGTRSFNLQLASGSSSEHRSPDMHYRRWHFRQLKDERYYQGEHEKKPRGSRWVFVRDTLVSAAGSDPYTASQ
jgi:hypothetical protein